VCPGKRQDDEVKVQGRMNTQLRGKVWLGRREHGLRGQKPPSPLVRDKANIMEVLTKAKVQLCTTCI